MSLELDAQIEDHRFGPFRISVAERVLWREHQVVPLAPKCFDTLLVLARHGGAVVEKATLMREVWPDTFVEEGSLTQNIFTLRKILGTLPEGDSYIQTIPKRGYRLVSPPAVQLPELQPAEENPQASRRHSWRSVSVVAPAMLLAAALILGMRLLPPGARTAAGTRFERLTVPNNVLYGVISQAGSQISYVSNDKQGQSLWVRDTPAVGAGLQVVAPVQGHFWGATFSPDGNYLYYALQGETSPAEASLYRIPVRGGQPQELLTGIATAPAFSPDASHILFKRYDPNGHGHLLTATALGADIRAIAQSDAAYSFYSYYWASDGGAICYVEGSRSPRGTEWSMWELPATGGTAKLVLGPQPKPLAHLAWLGRSEALSLIPDKDSGAAQIWSVAHGAFRRVSNDLNHYSQITATADGSTLLANTIETHDSMWIASSGEKNLAGPVRLALPPGSYNDPDWTPDGHVVFTAQANLWLSTADGSDRKPLLPGKAAVSESVVSPDGRFVVFAWHRPGGKNLWRSDLDGTNLRQLTDGLFDWHPAISPDSKWVIYESSDPGRPTLRKVSSAASGASVQLANTGGRGFSVSPDNQLLAYRTDVGEIEIRSMDDGSSIRTMPVHADPYGLRWTPDGKAVIYYCHSPGAMQFWKQAISGGPAVPTGGTLPNDVSDVSWSSDGRRVVYVRREIRVDLALITNFR